MVLNAYPPPMNDDSDAPFVTEPASGWQRLAEFPVTAARTGRLQLAQQLRDALRNLGLSDVLLEAVLEAVPQSVRRRALFGQTADAVAALQLRIWVATEPVCGRGWGFFLVEKPGSDAAGGSRNTGALLELFLYQEPCP